MHFCMIHSTCDTDFEINRYTIYECKKHTNIVFYLTSHDAKSVRRTSWGVSDRYFDQEHFETNQKSL